MFALRGRTQGARRTGPPGPAIVLGSIASFVASAPLAGCKATGSPFPALASPVVVAETVPADGATGVGVFDPIDLEFSGKILPTGLEPAFLLVESSSSIAVPFNARYEADDARVVSLEPIVPPLKLDTAYRVELQDGQLRDAKGRPIAGHTFEFRTVAAAATTIVRRIPAPGAVGVPTNFRVRIVFSEPLEDPSDNRIQALVNGSGFSGTTGYDEDARSLVFTHANPVASGDSIQVSLLELTDVYGREVENIGGTQTTFTLGAAPDTAAPLIAGAPSVSIDSTTGNATVTLPTITDGVTAAADLRVEVKASRAYVPPNGCGDAAATDEVRRVQFGTASPVVVAGLDAGSWTFQVSAEDGSGNRGTGTTTTVPVTAGLLTFADPVGGLLETRCGFAGCHAGGSPPGFFDLTGDLEQVTSHETQFDGMPALVPYCLSGSYLWRKVALSDLLPIEGMAMPPPDADVSALTRSERELLRRWIRQGAP